MRETSALSGDFTFSAHPLCCTLYGTEKKRPGSAENAPGPATESWFQLQFPKSTHARRRLQRPKLRLVRPGQCRAP